MTREKIFKKYGHQIDTKIALSMCLALKQHKLNDDRLTHKQITRVDYPDRPLYSEFWYRYKTDFEIMIMSIELVRRVPIFGKYEVNVKY